MISYDDIRQLQQYQSGPDSCVLSLYLNVDQSNAANLNRGFETRIESLFREVAESHNSDGGNKQRFEEEYHRVRRFLADYTPRGKALVLFSDSKNDFWWQRDLRVELPTGLRFSTKPWVRPLLEVIEEHDRLGIVLIDKQRARILTSDATGIWQQAEIVSDVPNKHVTTGTDHIWSQGQMDRDHAKHVQWHAKRAADELVSVVDRARLGRVVIGGPVEATSVFTAALPKRVQQIIIGTISSPVDASQERLAEELKAVQERAEQQDEVKLVDAMITAAMKGDRAVLGISDTLNAIQEGRVYRMIVARDFRTEGRECGSCHVLTLEGTDECSFCGGKLEPAPDLINRASHRVLETGGRIQLVSGEAASKLAGQGIGAVLRF
jgi:peptide chain release factor subunit 1